jgi:TolB protein
VILMDASRTDEAIFLGQHMKAVFVLFMASLTVCMSVSATPRHRILFNRVGPVSAGLFIADSDGNHERALLPVTGLDYSPSFSQDGRWVVFTSERYGSADIFRVRPDGTGLERLTDDPAYDDQAALSPDDRTLAFVSTRVTGRAHVWLMDLATRHCRDLTDNDASDFRPSWSPDGKWIAFTSDRDTQEGILPGRWEHLQSTGIYIVHPDGVGLRRLTAPGNFAGTPKWSADGKRIIYYETSELGTWYAQHANAQLGRTQVVSIDVATSSRTELTSGDGIRLWPQWLADGRIGYLVREASAPVGAQAGAGNAPVNGSAHLESVTRDGFVVRGPSGLVRNPSWGSDGKQVVYYRITSMSEPNLMKTTFSRDPDFELVWTEPFPAFSPRGDELAYAATPDGLNVHDTAIDVMKPDGSDRRRLFWKKGFSAFYPTWSPGGDQLAFSVGGYFRAPGHPAAQVAIIHADGTGLRMILDDGDNNGFPSWSPDGKRIVYKKNQHLVILSLDDNKLTELTAPGRQYDNFPQWSPKGDRIAFTSDRDGDFEIYTIKPDGTDLQRLTHSPGNDAHAVWSPDGKWMVFSSARMGYKDERPLSERIPQPYGELFVMRADGTDVRQLTDNQWEDATPAWMPEGQDAQAAQKR